MSPWRHLPDSLHQNIDHLQPSSLPPLTPKLPRNLPNRPVTSPAGRECKRPRVERTRIGTTIKPFNTSTAVIASKTINKSNISIVSILDEAVRGDRDEPLLAYAPGRPCIPASLRSKQLLMQLRDTFLIHLCYCMKLNNKSTWNALLLGTRAHVATDKRGGIHAYASIILVAKAWVSCESISLYHFN